jgi:predicted esterase
MRYLLLIALLAAPAQAQLFGDPAVRYELGQRLRMFERALAKNHDEKAIKRAIPPVKDVTPAFFAGRFGDAAAILDKARLTLKDEKPDAAKLWASSCRFVLPTRVGIPKEGKIKARIVQFYKPPVAAPKEYRVGYSMSRPGGGFGGGVASHPPNLSSGITVKWKDMPEGDFPVTLTIRSGEKVAFRSVQTLSLINNLDARLKKLEKSDALGKKTITSATLAHHLDILKKLAKGDTLEADYPGHRLLVEAEDIAAGKWATEPRKPGQYWLALPGVDGSPVRVFVPEQAKKGKPLPVVVALHGAGGSENMFFDAYGNGLVVELARKRGWFVVATRSPLAFLSSGPDVPAVLDALAKTYPIDTKKAFLVGHSMGAAQVVSLAGRKPERFAAVAALGGGGSFKETEGMKKLRFYVGVGEHDFALKSAKALAGRIEKAGAKVTFKSWPHLEHLTIVQMALPEAFKMFDGAAGK